MKTSDGEYRLYIIPDSKRKHFQGQGCPSKCFQSNMQFLPNFKVMKKVSITNVNVNVALTL